jgi:hypothetical protein
MWNEGGPTEINRAGVAAVLAVHSETSTGMALPIPPQAGEGIDCELAIFTGEDAWTS